MPNVCTEPVKDAEVKVGKEPVLLKESRLQQSWERLAAKPSDSK
jgi:hypothetical protein